jgi:hypothetical protein
VILLFTAHLQVLASKLHLIKLILNLFRKRKQEKEKPISLLQNHPYITTFFGEISKRSASLEWF